MSLAKVNKATAKHFLLGVDIFTHTHSHKLRTSFSAESRIIQARKLNIITKKKKKFQYKRISPINHLNTRIRFETKAVFFPALPISTATLPYLKVASRSLVLPIADNCIWGNGEKDTDKRNRMTVITFI